MKRPLNRSLTGFPAFILAGGRSSRMGTDKAWLEIEGVAMIERVLAAARPVSDRLAIIISADSPNREQYEKLAEKWNAKLLIDLHDHKGPLGGIDTALKDCAENEAALILACDLPFLTSEFLSILIGIFRREDCEIVVPQDPDERSQPLAAIYSTDCLPVIEKMLREETLRVDRMFPSVRLRRAAYDRYADLAFSERILHNVNTTIDR